MPLAVVAWFFDGACAHSSVPAGDLLIHIAATEEEAAHFWECRVSHWARFYGQGRFVAPRRAQQPQHQQGAVQSPSSHKFQFFWRPAYVQSGLVIDKLETRSEYNI